MIVVRPIGGLSEPSMLLVKTPDLVHHGVRGGLREGDGQGHVVIVILNMGNHSSHNDPRPIPRQALLINQQI